PAAAQEWSKRTRKEFHDASFPGLFHSAAAYRKIMEYAGRKGGSPSYHMLGHIIKSVIDVFNEEYPKIDPINSPRASVYNDVEALIDFCSGITSTSSIGDR
ncbi:MAG: hypothetical protein KGI29_07550, partial [Pseudomonadota bacterium]|nr:hypothetical protein [Pseudomonadota bacterium]